MRKKIFSKIFIFANIVALSLNNEATKAATWHYCDYHSGFKHIAGSNWCWVASAKNMAIGRFSSINVTKSQESVVKAIKGSVVYTGGTIGETKQAVKKFAPSSCSLGSVEDTFSKFYCQAEISAGDPIILYTHYDYLGIDKWHAVLLYGYDSDSSKMKIFDPDFGNTEASYSKLISGGSSTEYPNNFKYEKTIFYTYK